MSYSILQKPEPSHVFPDEVMAIHFPSWHSYPQMSSWKGKGWTEWELVKNAKPKFNGHHQPKEPVWGTYNDSDPVWAHREIDLASKYGITGFLVDWYWYDGIQLMQSQLEDGFLKAENSQKMKFALMWANHPWRNIFPTEHHKNATETECWLTVHHSLSDMKAVADYCIEHYFSKSNYWKIEGKPYFSFFALDELSKALGDHENIYKALQTFEQRVCDAGFPGVHFGANIGNMGNLGVSWNPHGSVYAKNTGFQSTFGYAIANSKKSSLPPTSLPVIEYQDVMSKHQELWVACDTGILPYFPTVSMGYDCSPRWHLNQKLPVPNLNYPYEPMIINNTPDLYEELCRHALYFLKNSKSSPKILFLYAWNEWTEGSYLLPEKKYGEAYLQGLKNALDQSNKLNNR